MIEVWLFAFCFTSTMIVPIGLFCFKTFIDFGTLQTLPVMKSGFSLCMCSLQGKTCNENRFFPVKNMYTGKTLFSLQGWVCSVGLKKANESDQAQTGFYVGFIFTF